MDGEKSEGTYNLTRAGWMDSSRNRQTLQISKLVGPSHRSINLLPKFFFHILGLLPTLHSDSSSDSGPGTRIKAKRVVALQKYYIDRECWKLVLWPDPTTNGRAWQNGCWKSTCFSNYLFYWNVLSFAFGVVFLNVLLLYMCIEYSQLNLSSWALRTSDPI